jgi:ABC-type sugar transport system permease subunit
VSPWVSDTNAHLDFKSRRIVRALLFIPAVAVAMLVLLLGLAMFVDPMLILLVLGLLGICLDC